MSNETQEPQEIEDTFESVDLGACAVDSGQLKIADPCYGPDEDEKGLTVTVDSPYGDGLFPVTAVYENGKMVGVYIDLDPYGISTMDFKGAGND